MPPAVEPWSPKVAQGLYEWFDRIAHEAKTYRELIAPRPGDADVESARAMVEMLTAMRAAAKVGREHPWLRRNS